MLIFFNIYVFFLMIEMLNIDIFDKNLMGLYKVPFQQRSNNVSIKQEIISYIHQLLHILKVIIKT